jgi:hypothetical protein
MNTVSKSTQQQLAIANGMTIGQLRTAISSQWQLEDDAKQFLAHYFLRMWHTGNLLALIKDGCLHYEDKKFQIVWYRGKAEATANKMCFLSFRKPIANNNIQAVVLIKQAPANCTTARSFLNH